MKSLGRAQRGGTRHLPRNETQRSPSRPGAGRVPYQRDAAEEIQSVPSLRGHAMDSPDSANVIMFQSEHAADGKNGNPEPLFARNKASPPRWWMREHSNLCFGSLCAGLSTHDPTCPAATSPPLQVDSRHSPQDERSRKSPQDERGARRSPTPNEHRSRSRSPAAQYGALTRSSISPQPRKIVWTEVSEPTADSTPRKEWRVTQDVARAVRSESGVNQRLLSSWQDLKHLVDSPHSGLTLNGSPSWVDKQSLAQARTQSHTGSLIPGMPFVTPAWEKQTPHAHGVQHREHLPANPRSAHPQGILFGTSLRAEPIRDLDEMYQLQSPAQARTQSHTG
eukprot:484568-Rhodomonas_salina.1